MRKLILLAVAITPLALAGCYDTAGNRGLGGAALGAGAAAITDNNPVTGAVIGGLAGVASCSLPNQSC